MSALTILPAIWNVIIIKGMSWSRAITLYTNAAATTLETLTSASAAMVIYAADGSVLSTLTGSIGTGIITFQLTAAQTAALTATTTANHTIKVTYADASVKCWLIGSVTIDDPAT